MTTTSVITAQSFGTLTNVGDNKLSIAPVALQSGSTAFVVNVQVTTGAADGNPEQEVRVWYTTSPRTFTAANAPISLAPTARYVDIRPSSRGSTILTRDSSLEPVTGASFYCWVSLPRMNAAAILDVSLVELP